MTPSPEGSSFRRRRPLLLVILAVCLLLVGLTALLLRSRAGDDVVREILGEAISAASRGLYEVRIGDIDAGLMSTDVILRDMELRRPCPTISCVARGSGTSRSTWSS